MQANSVFFRLFLALIRRRSESMRLIPPKCGADTKIFYFYLLITNNNPEIKRGVHCSGGGNFGLNLNKEKTDLQDQQCTN